MTIQLNRRLLTAEEYHKMGEVGILTEDDRIELIYGEIIQMSPIGSEHAGTINRINALLNESLGSRVIVSVQNPLRIDDLSEPEPDIAILRPDANFYADRHPTPQDVFLLIEVADTSLTYDREVKIPMYANAGISEYWIINLQRSELEVYLEPKENTYGVKKTFNSEGVLHIESLDLQLQLQDLLG